MIGYTKVFSSLLDSSLWVAGDKATKLVWVTMLLMKDRNQEVQASVPGLAARAGVSVEECRGALRVLLEPDEESRSRSYDGRRVEAVDGGWVVLNGAYYRDRMTKEDRNEYQRIKQAEYRARKKAEEERRKRAGNGKPSGVGRTPRARALPGEEAAQRTDGRGAEAIAAESVARFAALPAQLSTKEPEAVPVLEGAVPAVPPGEAKPEIPGVAWSDPSADDDLRTDQVEHEDDPEGGE